MRNIRLIFLAAIVIMNCSSAPKGERGQAAEELAQRMQAAVNFKKFQATAAIEFSFRDDHFYFWDRKRKLVEVKWSSWGDDIEVQFDKGSFKGRVIVDSKEVADHQEKKDYIKKAYKYFVNDSYWLNPVFHFYAPAAERSLVDGKKLLITFRSGGVTPGDAYEFTPNEQNRVAEMRIWASILPIKGATATFKDHATADTGFGYAKTHKVLMANVSISKVKGYLKYPTDNDRFAKLIEALKQ